MFFLLESRGFDCQLHNPARVKAPPGRPKTDKLGSIWLGKITERGTVASSFVLVAGQRDTSALAQLARGTMRGKIRRLEEALDCSFFTGGHAAVLAMMLAVIDATPPRSASSPPRSRR